MAFFKVDVDNEEVDEIGDFISDCNINAMPTFIVFSKGVKVEDMVGANEAALIRLLDKHNASA